MICSANRLIEKFATMLEESQHLDNQQLTKNTMEIIHLLSTDPSLNDMMTAINSTLKAILLNADALQSQGIATTENVHRYVAAQLRMLKIKPH